VFHIDLQTYASNGLGEENIPLEESNQIKYINNAARPSQFLADKNGQVIVKKEAKVNFPKIEFLAPQ
jgi:hypothetical protein